MMQEGDTIIPGPWAERRDRLDEAPVRRLEALLDHAPDARSTSHLPTLAHWLYFLPEDRQSALGPDGHPLSSRLLGDSSLPRRMWAGGRLRFHGPLSLGASVVRRTRTERIREKSGRSGRLCFVTLLHEILAGGSVAISEEQDLVFRETEPGHPSPPDVDPRIAEATRPLTLDAAALFRFSALTFNAHRIHYDQAYATAVEGYPNCIVQGPFQAMLLADLVHRAVPGADIAEFSFRGVRPLIVDQSFDLNLTRNGDIAELWSRDAGGYTCMQATATLR